MRSWLSRCCVAASVLCATPAFATTIAFVPPNDTTGSVLTINQNDAYAFGRGDVFHVNANTTIDSVGIFQDLTNITLDYQIYEVPSTSFTTSTGATLLASGSAPETTSGLQWIDFAITPLTLLSGNNYDIRFSFVGNSNQNFFYNNNNVPFTEGNFSSIDGEAGFDTTNFVMPAIRIDAVTAPTAVPEPATLTLLGTGLLVAVRRRRRR